MDAYLEIRLLPDPEFVPTTLMNALFNKLHHALVAHGGQNIGVSFPDVGKNDRSLGERLRLHSHKAELEKLMASNWLVGIRDHTIVSEAVEVPAHAQQRIVRRVQAKSNPERLRRRLMQRKGIDHEAAAQAIPDSASERLTLPYVTLTSSSTCQQFRLFIQHGPLASTPTMGRFTHYGLSSTTTIPWF